MSAIYQYKTYGLQLKDVDSASRVVKGRFAAFGNKDADGDVIVQGAFARTIAENGPKSLRPRIKHLLNHDISIPLGKLIELSETSEGLDYESKIGTHRAGDDFLKMVDSDLVNEHSIGFRIIKGTGRQDHYEIQEVQLWEGSSLTGWGANEFTPLYGKSIEQIQTRVKALEKFCRNSDASDETIELLLLEIKQLSQRIIDLEAGKSAPAADPLNSNQPEDYTPLVKSLDSLYNIFNN